MSYSNIITRFYKKLPIGDKNLLASYMDDVYWHLDVAGEGPSVKVDVNLILDELITNVFMHGYKDKETKDEWVKVSIIVTETHIIIRIRDKAIEFNPLEHVPKLPESDDIFDLELGGLGVFMVRERVETFDYKYENGQNVQTLIKELPVKFYKNEYFRKAQEVNAENEEALKKFMAPKERSAKTLKWKDWQELTGVLTEKQKQNGYAEHTIPLTITKAMQKGAYKVDSDYQVNIHACSWGNKNKPPLICFGGILNTAERFVVLARSLAEDFFVVGVSWAGRGSSDWLTEQDDYSLDNHVAHIDAVLDYFKFKEKPIILGSSLGGSAAMKYLADKKNQAKVKGLILNDTGYIIPASRRARRSIKVARYYSFNSPQELLRRYEVASRAEGYTPESFLLLYSHWQTKEVKQGIYSYNHDYRALAAYRQEACDDLDLSQEWQAIDLPILLLHGNLSTALSAEICNEMMKGKPSMRMAEIKHVGHTPPLTDEQIIGYIGGWMKDYENDEISRQYTINPKKYEREKVFVFNEASKKTAVIKEQPLVQEFYVVRHGLTDFNKKAIRCGSDHDVPINKQGAEEAIRLGIALNEILDKGGEKQYSRIYCGGLQRLLKTAYIIAHATGIHNLYTDMLFDERQLGEYSGTPHDKHEADIRGGIPPKHGESEGEFAARVAKALDIVFHHVAVTPIIVTSRGVIIRMLRMLAGDKQDLVQTRDVIYHFKYDSGKETWSVKKIDVSKTDFDKDNYKKILKAIDFNAI